MANPTSGLPVPPLPPSWPFGQRTRIRAWERREALDLGDLGAGWTVTLPQGLDLSGTAGPLEGAFGRGGIQRRGDLVLRPYRRGGLVRFFIQSTYMSPRRFEREWLIHCALWEAGFPTVEPLGFGFRRQGLAFEGIYLSAFTEGRAWPADWAAGVAMMGELRTALDALGAWGLWAPDLNATNVLLAEDGLRILDWDRAAFLPAADLQPLYRRRLLRSLARLGAPDPAVQAFLSALDDPNRPKAGVS